MLEQSRLNELADMIERSKTYDQRGWTHSGDGPFDCGTPACVAGHACVLSGARIVDVGHRGHDGRYRAPIWEYEGRRYATYSLAKKWLGLSYDQDDPLFNAYTVPDPDVGRREPTRDEAAATLRRLAVTGKVEWRAKNA